MKELQLADGLFGTGLTGDVSQLGDWSSFRNVVIDGKFGIVTTEMYNPMPRKGLMHFDFNGAGMRRFVPQKISLALFCHCLLVLL